MKEYQKKVMQSHAESLVLRLVAEFFEGNQSLAAKGFNTSRQAIQQWVHQGFLPARRVFEAQKITGGQISAEEFMDEFIAKNPNRAL